MLIHSIKLSNFLSFGEKPERIDLHPLNVIIGPNGSGKSNLLEAIGLFASTPTGIEKTVINGGGTSDWIWKGSGEDAEAVIDAEVSSSDDDVFIAHKISFREVNHRFEVTDEDIGFKRRNTNEIQRFLYRFQRGNPFLLVDEKTEDGNSCYKDRFLRREDIHPAKSILEQRKGPENCYWLNLLGTSWENVYMYREWTFGRSAPHRKFQPIDLPHSFSMADMSNLGLILNQIRKSPSAKKKFLENLKKLYEGIEDFDVNVEGKGIQTFIQEGNRVIPANRLSDGTLRYLCLLAILCHPAPPVLVCIEEPELGLHPDIVVSLAELLTEASSRMQLIVTTHSNILVEALKNQPDSILVCEKEDSGTTLKRLDAEELELWLKSYGSGQLSAGGAAGNRVRGY